jgi:outer membrane protein assembly factor BamD (BamD/ComL family)
MNALAVTVSEGVKAGLLALILGWILYIWLKRTHDDPGRLIGKWILTAIFLPASVIAVKKLGPFGIPILVICCIILGLVWAPTIAGVLASPLTGAFDGGGEEVEPQPFYSAAETKRKQGRHTEAIAEIQRQLHKFPNDFQGQIMMAEIQGDNLKDLQAASFTVERLVNQHGHAPKNIAYALNRLADWHLNLAEDPDSARADLERIIDKFPDSIFAQNAQQRIAHLSSKEMLAEKKQPRRVRIGQYRQKIGLENPQVTGQETGTTTQGQGASAEDPAALAEHYVERLNHHPQDHEAREQLALLYARHYRRIDLAIEQLQELLKSSHASQRRMVHWLNMMADIQVHDAGNVEQARAALQRVIDLFPDTPSAENARQRITRLNLEAQGKQKSQVVRLGSYEQNIGLKSRSGNTDAERADLTPDP